MNLSENLQRIIDAKSTIKTAIENKGVLVGNGAIDTYAGKINAINTVQGAGKHLVRFFDIDGKILKQIRCNTGESVSCYSPTRQWLSFYGWNIPTNNVQSDIDTGAIYSTEDGKSHLFIRLTMTTGISPTLYLNKSNTAQMTIEWGDGNSTVSTASGNLNFNHTYAAAGDYHIKISCGGGYTFGNGTTATTVFGDYQSSTYRYALKKIYICGNVSTILYGAFFYQLSLEEISLCNSINLITSVCFSYSSNIKIVIAPSSLSATGISGAILSACNKISVFIIPSSLTTIPSSFINSAGGVEKMIFHSAIVSIGSNAFLNNTSTTEYIFMSTVPPTLASTNAFSGINLSCKIYVPDASVAAYKTATNWSTYSSYIYPLSSKS